MKHTNTIVTIVLAVSIIVLYILHFCVPTSCKTPGKSSTSGTASLSSQLPIAYINIDSLLLNYTYSKDLNEILIRKRENAQATLTQKARLLDAEMQEFQRKHENNAFLSEQSFKSQQQALVKKQQDLQALEENLTQELMKEQQKMNEQLRDSIYKFLQTYNKDKKYTYILNAAEVLIGDETTNITRDVLVGLNARYSKAKLK